MEFPDAKRVVYKNNPLVEVVCQLKFPRILALEERVPAEFQARLGADYPLVEMREGFHFNLSMGEDAIKPVTTRFKHYDFLPDDRSTKITLTSEFIAVSTLAYRRWEIFEAHILRALDALSASYSIPFFSRVGLRYVDVISRQKLGIPQTRWSDLIRRSALGLLAEDEVPVEDVAELNAATVVELDNGGKATLRTQLGQHEAAGSERVFIVDSDFFLEEVRVKGTNDAIDVCQRFNRTAGRAFRWLIRDELHARLDPEDPS